MLPHSSKNTAESDAGLMRPLSGVTSLDPSTPTWSGNLSSGAASPRLMGPLELENGFMIPGMVPSGIHADQNLDHLTDNNQVALPEQGLLDANFDLDFDQDFDPNFGQYCVPDMPSTVPDPSSSNGSISGDLSMFEHTHTGVSDSNSSRPPKVTELLENFDQPGLRDNFPQISNLCKIIGLLEELIQKKETTIDEVLRANKFCMNLISSVMKSDFFKKCKSCRMLILTAMDLVITLYETGVSEDMKWSSQSSRSQSADQTFGQKASLQFGVFEFEPEDHVMIRNQIVRNELQRCIQTIQGQSSELRNSSSDGSTPSHKIHENWFNVIENRARILTSSLKSMDVPM